MKKSTQAPQAVQQGGAAGAYNQLKHMIGLIVTWIYHLRKVILAAPVIYFALRLAAYNTVNLPLSVGLLLQSDGTFAMQISRYTAVVGSLAITGGCLAMMFLSRKALYAWAISVFTLAIPVLLLISNLYPA